jgi:hypothetical protein
MQNKPTTLAFWCTAALMIFASWVTGGTQPAWQKPFLPLAALTLISTFVASKESGRFNPTIFRDSVFYIGLAFILILFIQWLNSGRSLLIDWDSGNWTYSPPPVPWLPSAIRKGDAFEMIRWFLPAWAIALCIRHGLGNRKEIRKLLTIVFISAGLLGLLSVGQYAIATLWDLCPPPSKNYFVTSFGYSNHAGAYFNLMLCLGFGLLFQHLFAHDGKGRFRTIILAVCTVFVFLAANVSEGRAAMLMSWIIALLAGLYAIFAGWTVISRSRKFNRIVIVGFAGVMSFLVIYGFGREVIHREFVERTRPASTRIEAGGEMVKSAGFGSRSLQRKIAVSILSDYFWFGAGGWAHRYLGYTYVAPQNWSKLAEEGKANVHNDPLQFLGEFGLTGVALLALLVFINLAPLAHYARRIPGRPLILFSLLGLMLILGYSFFDLPFRSPAILFKWTAFLASISRLAPHIPSRKPQTNPRILNDGPGYTSRAGKSNTQVPAGL